MDLDTASMYFGVDSLDFIPGETITVSKKDRVYDPKKAAMLSAALPGLGQIYNRKYWKLPFIYGGFAGLGYGIYWNNKWYLNYKNYYSDYVDNDPTTNRYYEVITQDQIDTNFPNKEDLANKFQQRRNSYRRDRDYVIIFTVGLYVLNILDASVDAHLSDFDIGKELSLKVKPKVEYMDLAGQASVGIGCSLRFK